MKILHISAECYPIAKVGGLADVVGSLPKHQNDEANTSEVIMPFYDNSFTRKNSFTTIYASELELGEDTYSYEIKTLLNSKLGFEVYFVVIPHLLYTDYVYSYDDTDRFLGFQIAVLDWLVSWDNYPEIIHCHDHHTALVPFMMSQAFKYKKLRQIPTVLTIHNAQYQGWFSYEKLFHIPPFEKSNIGLLDWDNQINPLATGIKCAWRVTTVSPSYMEELKKHANGLELLLQHESAKCSGILNGIDIAVWNPESDPYLEKNYVSRIVQSGKKSNKNHLCSRFGLDKNKPLFVFIGRLVGEKGADLFAKAFEEALEKNVISILLLGSGNKKAEAELQALRSKFKGSYNTYIGYDEKLAHNMYAGADFLLMPSRVEPCGLNQLYALRYGTIPVVRSTGGLRDTVIDVSEKGFGFVHQNASVPDIVHAIERAEKLYRNKEKFKSIRNTIMKINHSWDASAKAYISLYNSIIQ